MAEYARYELAYAVTQKGSGKLLAELLLPGNWPCGMSTLCQLANITDRLPRGPLPAKSGCLLRALSFPALGADECYLTVEATPERQRCCS